jgi:hypothetical protein
MKTTRIRDYFRFPARYNGLAACTPLSEVSGYFRFGEQILYGSCLAAQPAESAEGALEDVAGAVRCEGGMAYLPFDVDQVVNNLRGELYAKGWAEGGTKSALADLYYFVRPILPVAVRKHLQKMHLSGWEKIPFPHWPVDRTVDMLMERLLLLAMRAQGVKQIPFIWFWPNGASGCALMTHDVETELGQSLCPMLMDMNDSFGIQASFQVIPEERYLVTPQFLDSIRKRGFEIVVHDLNHDGHLYGDRERFLQRAAKINAYGKQYGAVGFRAGVLYRNQSWFSALDFEYDMSVPSVAHLDPQRGGCCTVMPYFIGDLLELPVTVSQDYSLFHILRDYSTRLWEEQIESILQQNGLINVIIHPDYLTGSREKGLYAALLSHLAELRERSHLWITTPAEANRWWRQRAQLEIVEEDGQLRLAGPGSERAGIVYASEHDGKLVYTPVPVPEAQCGAWETMGRLEEGRQA